MNEIRIDRWLWAARFFKTRSIATKAVAGGKARLNGSRTRPGTRVSVGDVIEVRKGSWRCEVVVEGLADRRGPASEARTLYRETEESVRRREALAARRRHVARAPEYEGRGRPTKKERRELERLRRLWEESSS